MRYFIKFYKKGYMRYTSHLDMLRLFKRTFKRSGIKLQHSHGFNPHPKMSFAQPLSLGYYSIGEYLEFETIEDKDVKEIKLKVNSILPDGIGILECHRITKNLKSMASMVSYGEYDIKVPYNENDYLKYKMTEFLSQEHIIINKIQKKSGKIVEIDIKPMILNLSHNKIDDNHIMLTSKISTGSLSNLSPENLLGAFLDFFEIKIERSDIDIKRNELYCSDKENLITLAQYFS
ncbi:TIGR03936 family radical SAM-associated protein [Anaerovorax odorimutans]|uniref:TIGR03936 family radical SAM-associated protein n=1 Tax=Anaerovorax odorimutans TaxID=109327 RepID=UPI000406D7E8|nr:TIGR03936 family radical SAM-associated protein [Anaerovorax odorimutans]